MANAFGCTLVTPEQQLFDEQIAYASVPGWDGLLGVAPERAPMLIKLGSGPLRLDLATGNSRWFFVAGGFAQMKNNQLTLVAQGAIEADQLDAAKVKTELQEAQALEAIGDEQTEQKRLAIEAANHKLELLNQVGSSH